jgi:hypothetical protein
MWQAEATHLVLYQWFSMTVSFGTVSFGGVTRLISDESTAKTRLSHRGTPLLLTVPVDNWSPTGALNRKRKVTSLRRSRSIPVSGC